MGSSSPDNFDDFHSAGSGNRTRVVFLSGPGGGAVRGPGLITKVLVGLVAVGVLALAASFAVVIAAIFAGLIVLLLAAAWLRHLWRRLTGRAADTKSGGVFGDSGVHFSGRVVVTRSGPVVRRSVSSSGTVIDVTNGSGGRLPAGDVDGVRGE